MANKRNRYNPRSKRSLKSGLRFGYAPTMQDVQELPELKGPKWPFFLAVAFMLGLAFFLFYYQAKLTLTHWEALPAPFAWQDDWWC